MFTTNNTIWLSHPLDSKTPAYGNGVGFTIKRDKKMDCGDSCNTATINIPNHLGTHVDAPRHFVSNGKSVDQYLPTEWIFNDPVVLDIDCKVSHIIDAECFNNNLNKINIKNKQNIDLVLFRTGFEKLRYQDDYWQHNPSFAPDLAEQLLKIFPSLKAIGMDSLSLTGFQEREMGREAHREFLGKGIRVFEDMSLHNIKSAFSLKIVIALPLIYEAADGAPCTILGFEK